MRPAWEDAIRRGDIGAAERLWIELRDIDAKDRRGQTALMIAVREDHGVLVTWLIEHGAELDHTAKYGLSALMTAVVRGHVDIVRRLVNAGANTSLRGTGAPGFADKTALDLAVARDDRAMIEILRAASQQSAPASDNPHFASAQSWHTARTMLTFRPLVPAHTMGLGLKGLRVHVRDHKLREVPIGDRTLEAHYGGFVLSQSWKGAEEARRLALEVSYGREVRDARVSGHPARVYELGPEPEPDDLDGRSPAVVTWHEGDMFYLVASDEMSSDVLVSIALSVYLVERRLPMRVQFEWR